MIPTSVISPAEFVRLTPSREREFEAVGVRAPGARSQIYVCIKTSDDEYIWSVLTDQYPLEGVTAFRGAIADIPDGWQLCDGTNGTPDLRNLFIVGAGDDYAVGATGGADEVTLTIDQMPDHDHVMGLIAQAQPGSGGPLGFFAIGSPASTGDEGGGQAHENRPPFYALAWITKVA